MTPTDPLDKALIRFKPIVVATPSVGGEQADDVIGDARGGSRQF
jgi:hypothetical protein